MFFFFWGGWRAPVEGHKIIYIKNGISDNTMNIFSLALCSVLTVCVCVHTQLYPKLCNPMDCSLLGPSLHRILQAKILEWVAISYTRGSFQSRDPTCIGRWLCYHWATWEALTYKPYIPLLMRGNYISVIISCSIYECSVFREIILVDSLKWV